MKSNRLIFIDEALMRLDFERRAFYHKIRIDNNIPINIVTSFKESSNQIGNPKIILG